MANKLYTEEQVKRIAKLYRQELYILEAAINTETPIELPSDEEIEEALFHQSNEYAIGFHDAFKEVLEFINDNFNDNDVND